MRQKQGKKEGGPCAPVQNSAVFLESNWQVVEGRVHGKSSDSHNREVKEEVHCGCCRLIGTAAHGLMIGEHPT